MPDLFVKRRNPITGELEEVPSPAFSNGKTLEQRLEEKEIAMQRMNEQLIAVYEFLAAGGM